MQQKIHGLNVHASPSLSAYAEQKIFQPLSQMAHHLTTVVLRFRDEDVQDPHSPREARAVVTTTDGQVLVARDREDNDLYAAVDRLAHRIRRQVKDHARKQRDRARRRR